MRIKRKKEISKKNKQTCKDKINMKKKTKREIDKQVFFFRFATVPSTCLSERLNVLETRKNEEKKRDNRWTNPWAKGHTEVTHAFKKG